MTQRRPGGTVTLNVWADGWLPGYRYELSVSGTPLTVIWPLALQQATWSPGSPITRLM